MPPSSLSPFNWIDRLEAPVRDELLARCRNLSLQPGEFLWRSGDADHCIYQLAEGQIKLYTLTADGQELVQSLFSAGDCLGERGLFIAGQHQSMAQALEPCRLRRLSLDAFRELADRHPGIAWEMMSYLARCIALLRGYLDTLNLNDLEASLAARIILLVEQRAPLESSQALSLALTQSDLANMLSTTRQSISRILSGWQSRGLIEHVRGNLTIHDVAAIKQLRNLDRD